MPWRKITLLATKTALIEERVYSFANPNWKAKVQSRKADEYHSMSSTVRKWIVMLGTAVTTMLTSRSLSIRITHRAMMVNQNLEPVG